MIIAAEPSFLDRVGDLGPLLAAGSTGLFGAIFLLLGHWLGRRGDTMTWRRDRRLAAYTRFLTTAAKQQDLRTKAWAREDHDARLGEVNRMVDGVSEFSALLQEIRLLGPEEVADVADDVHDLVLQEIGSLSERGKADEKAGTHSKQNDEESEAAAAEWARVENALFAAARPALK